MRRLASSEKVLNPTDVSHFSLGVWPLQQSQPFPGASHTALLHERTFSVSGNP